MSTGTIWALIVLCALVTFAIKAAGPVALGGRELPAWASDVITLMAPALLAALVVTSALADRDRVVVGPDTAGVLAGGLVVWRGGSVVLAVAVAAAVAAGVRAAGV